VTRVLTVERLAALIQGAAPNAADHDALALDDSWRLAERHGVTELLAAGFVDRPDLDAGLRARLVEATRCRVIADLAQEAQLRACLGALTNAGIEFVLMKGAQLAYTHYPRPDLRPRLDTDLVIRAAQRQEARAALEKAGYLADVQASEDLVLRQQTYVNAAGHGLPHVVDLHWRIANPEVFGGVLAFEEIAAEAVTVGQLGDDVRGLSPVHALLLACVHRVAHHHNADRLIWLYDIHLVATTFDEGQWTRLAGLARDREVAAVCAAGLERARALFGTPVPEAVQELAGVRPTSELTARYLIVGRAPVIAVVDDLRAMPSWHHRWRLVKDYAFPPVRYMREVYAPSSVSPLPWLYLRRIVFGARRWLAHS
jgi:hypothetical protein